jgi:hypothetical protein
MCVVTSVSEDCVSFLIRVSQSKKTALLASEEEGTTFLQNVMTYWLNDTASHARRLEFQQHCCEKLILQVLVSSSIFVVGRR